MKPGLSGKVLLLLCVSLLVACGGSSEDSSEGNWIKDVEVYRDSSQCEIPDLPRASEKPPPAGLEDAFNAVQSEPGSDLGDGLGDELENLEEISPEKLAQIDSLDISELTQEQLEELFNNLLNNAERDVTNYLDNIDLSTYEADYEKARKQVEDAAYLLTSLKSSTNNIPYPAINFPDETWYDHSTIPNENLSDRLRLRLHKQLEEKSVTLGFAITDELGLAMKNISPEQVLIEGLNALGEKVEEYNKFRFSNILAELASSRNEFSVSAVNDYSGSMRGELDEVELSLRGFYKIFPDQAQTEIIKFSEKTFIYYPMAIAVGPELRAAINRRPQLGLTAIYDAVTSGVVNLCKQPGYNAVLLLTDGMDNASSVTLNETIAFAKANRVPVFVIAFGYANKIVLKRITEETGGAYIYFPYEVYEEMMMTQGQKPWDLAYSLMGNLYVYDYLLDLAEVSPEVKSIKVSVKTDTGVKMVTIAL